MPSAVRRCGHESNPMPNHLCHLCMFTKTRTCDPPNLGRRFPDGFSIQQILEPTQQRIIARRICRAARFTQRIMWPTLHVAHRQPCAPILSNRNRNAASDLFRPVQVPAVLEEGKASLNRIKVQFHELVCNFSRARDLATIDSQQLARKTLKLNFGFCSRLEMAQSIPMPQ